MKKLISLFFVLVFFVAINAWSYEDPSDCKNFSVGCVKSQFNVSDNGVWAPQKGAILFYGNGDTTLFRYNEFFQVFLYFDEMSVNFYKNNSWAGFEIDILFPDAGNYSLPRIDPDSVSGPAGTYPLRDTIVSYDNGANRGITVTHPSSLKAGWNVFYFEIKDNLFVDLGDNIRIKANIQLVANVGDDSFVNVLYDNNSISWISEWLSAWILVEDAGYTFSLGGEVFKYFSMADFMQAVDPREPLYVSSNTVGEGLCWANKNSDNLAFKCNSTNFISIINSSQPSDNSEQENKENEVKPSTNGELANEVAANTGFIVNNSDPIPTDPDYDPDIHINSLDIRTIGGSYSKEIQKTLYWGQSFQFEGRAEFENKSSAEAKDIDADYRITDSRSSFNEDATKIDEDGLFNINPGEREENTIKPITITVSTDGTRVSYSQGSMTKNFDVINGFSKVYIFADIEVNGDKDISSPSDHDEYGKIELIILEPPCQPSFTVTPLSGVRPLVVSFTNISISKAADCTYAWNFGDGGTSNVYNPSYVYNNAGTFVPKLTANSYSYSYSTTKNGNTISITNPIPPSMMITNPTGNDNWRSDNTKHITWNRYNFPTLGNVRIDYTMDGGAIWRNIDTVTPNDGSRYWNMCSSYTVDSGNSYIRICSLEYGVCATSAKFYIDHAKGCK